MTAEADNQAKPAERSPGRIAYVPVLEALLIGAAAGLSAVLLLHGIRAAEQARLAVDHAYPYWGLPLVGLAGGAFSGLLVHFYPEVAGSGIPQVRAILERINLRLDLKSAIVKLIGGVVALGCGLFMGREGPTVQVGAGLASSLTRVLPSTAAHQRQLVAAGAGAGLAAAFSAPLAGVTFVLEELLKEANARTILLALVACCGAAVVENLAGSAHSQAIIQTATGPTPVALGLPELLAYALLGGVCAVCGVAFNAAIMWSLRMYKRSRLPTVARTALAGLITGVVISLLPESFAQYDHLREAITTGALAPNMVPLAFVTFFFLVVLAYGSGAPGGLFAPALMLGAAIGYMVGWLYMQVTGVNLISVFTQVGMGAMFSAVARVPLTATVIVFEMSGNFGLIPPLMLAGVIGSRAAERLSPGSLYDTLMVWSGINVHGPATVEAARETKVADIMEHGDYAALENEKIYVSPDDTIDEILYLFSKHGFERLPVREGNAVVGVVDRKRAVETLFALTDSE